MTLLSSTQQVNPNCIVKDNNGPITTWSKLDDLRSIEDDTKTFLTQHEGLAYTAMADKFEGIKTQLTLWMENAHLAIFTLEQKVKDGAGISSSELLLLQTKMAEMENLMGHFGDISDLMDEKFDETSNMDVGEMDGNKAAMATSTAAERMAFKMKITKLQSEWSGLHHFMVSVTKQVESANEKRELLVMMENTILDIDNLTSTIFEYQEKRHLGLAVITTESGSVTLHKDSLASQGTNTPKSNGDASSLKDETLLADLDQRVEPVFLGVEKIYARMNSTMRPPHDDSGILVRKHRLVQEKWECLRIEIDELKDELKEDRWLSVFRQVADQVDTMINGLNKSVQECYNAIQQIHDWHDMVQQHNYSHSTSNDISSPNSPSPFDKISKTIMRSFPRNHHHHSSASVASSSTSTASTTIPPPPFDHKKFRSIEKGFEAKYTYYTPSVDRMLTMLGNGIASRSTKDNSISKRQAFMLSRWQQLKATMEELRSHDLANAERCLVEVPLSPVSSVQSDKSYSHGMWKSIRRRASNQEGSNISGSTSTISSLPRVATSTSQHEDYRRVRSVTPSSGSQQHPDRYHQSTKPYSRQQRTTSPLNFASHPSSTYHHNKLIRPSTSETSSIESGSPLFRSTFGGRKSLTPSRPAWNTSVKPDKPEFSSLEPLWKGESRMDHTSSSSSSSSISGRYQQGRKSLVPRPPSAQQHHHSKEASFMKPTKSTMLRKRSQSVEPPDIGRPKTPTHTKKQPSTTIGSNDRRRTKTPTSSEARIQYHLPPRPKSSLGRQESHNLLPYVDRERDLYDDAKSPIRRSGTPSLIPRPKTPNGDHLPSISPSLLPRPRSSMRTYYQDDEDIPPVPPLPSNIDRPSIHLLKAGILNKNDVYDDMEHNDDNDDDDDHPPFVSPDSFLSVPPVFDNHDLIQQTQRSRATAATNVSNKTTQQQRKRELLKKRSMPAIAIKRSGSPFQSSPATPTIRTTMPVSHQHQDHSVSSRRRRRSGYYSEDEDNQDEDDMISPHSPMHDHPIYTGDPRDPLDMEVATILNSSPIAMQCQKSPQGVGKYYFGNELNPTISGGKKLYTCKLINYTGRPSRRQHGADGSMSMMTKNKVLVRVGGGWTELSQFLLDHALFM